jgi:hypothetical protein
LDDIERYLFDLNGYLVVKAALTTDEVSRINAVIDAMPPWDQVSASSHAHTGLDRESTADGNTEPTEGPIDFYSGLLLEWGEPIRRLVGHATIRPYLEELLGDTNRLDHQYAIFMKNDHVFAGGHALHGGGTPFDPSQYYLFRNGRMHSGLTVVSYALTDAPAGAGGFCCVPGSHKANYPLPPHFRELFDPVPSVQHVPVAAGDAILFTEALSHGCLRWNAEHERRALLFKYSPGHIQWEKHSQRLFPADHAWRPDQAQILEGPYFGGRPPIVTAGGRDALASGQSERPS